MKSTTCLPSYTPYKTDYKAIELETPSLQPKTVSLRQQYRIKAETKKKVMEDKEDVWNQALRNLRRTHRVSRRNVKTVFNHLVSFYTTCKAAGWEADEVENQHRQKSVFNAIWKDWKGQEKNPTQMNAREVVEEAILNAIAEVWGEIQTAVIEEPEMPEPPVRKSKQRTTETGSTEAPTEIATDGMDYAAEYEFLVEEARQSDANRLQFLENLEAHSTMNAEQRGWLDELRKKVQHGG